MTDFYVYLFSQSSQSLFPENTLSNFKTQLNSPLQITRDSYKVALTQLSYYKSNKILSTIEESEERKIYCIFKDAELNILHSFVYIIKNNATNLEELYSEIKICLSPLLYYGFKVNIREYNKRTVLNILKETPEIIPPNQRSQFQEIVELYTKVHKAYDLEIKFDNKILAILGYDIGFSFNFIPKNKIDLSKPAGYISNYSPNIDFGKSLIFLYCDFVENIHTGESSAPILRIIPTGNEKPGTLIYYNFDNPFYMELSREFIQVLHIILLNENGKEVTLDRGIVNLTLHFKPKKL